MQNWFNIAFIFWALAAAGHADECRDMSGPTCERVDCTDTKLRDFCPKTCSLCGSVQVDELSLTEGSVNTEIGFLASAECTVYKNRLYTRDNEIASKLAQDAMQFAWDLMQKIGSDSQVSDNFVFSPADLMIQLGLLREGTDGVTESQISHNVFPSMRSPSYTLLPLLRRMRKSDNILMKAMFMKHSDFVTGEQFRAQSSSCYKISMVATADLRSNRANVEKIMNLVISGGTDRRVKQVLRSYELSSKEKLILGSGFSFEDNWRLSASFSSFSGKFLSSRTTMLRTKAMLYLERNERRSFTLVGIPFKNQEQVFYVLLPDSKYGLDELVSEMDARQLRTAVASAKLQYVDLTIPRFTVRSRFMMKKYLRKLGIYRIFDDSAEMQKAFEHPDAKLDEIFHATYLNVNKNGAGVSLPQLPSSDAVVFKRDYEVKADHPFVFFIFQPYTGAILNLGSVRSM